MIEKQIQKKKTFSLFTNLLTHSHGKLDFIGLVNVKIGTKIFVSFLLHYFEFTEIEFTRVYYYSLLFIIIHYYSLLSYTLIQCLDHCSFYRIFTNMKPKYTNLVTDTDDAKVCLGV